MNVNVNVSVIKGATINQVLACQPSYAEAKNQNIARYVNILINCAKYTLAAHGSMNHPSSKNCARAQAAFQTGVCDLIMISVSTIVKLCQIDQSIIMCVPSDRLFILRTLCNTLAHAASPANPNAHDGMQIERPLNCFHFNLFFVVVATF